MKLATGTVIEGKVVIEGDPLPEGCVVTVLAPDGDETFAVPPDRGDDTAHLISCRYADRKEADDYFVSI